MWKKNLFFTFSFILILTGHLFSQTLEIPVITNVSVDRISQKAQISWSMNNVANIDGYIVLRQIFGQAGVVDGSFNTIATISNSNQFSYIDSGTDYGVAKPGSVSENYRVASFKVIGGVTVYSNMSNTVSSIYLSPIDFNQCLEQNTLKWSAFNGFGTDLLGYRIYYSNTANGIPVLIKEVDATQTSYIHSQVLSNISYYYYVEAFNKNRTIFSASNVQLINTNMPAVPTIMYANYGTVDLYNEIKLSFTVDANAVVGSYLLLRSSTKSGNYDSIASFPRGSSIITFSDFLKTNQEIAYYKVVAINTCGLKSRESNIAHNIVLEAYPSGQLNQLKWNSYEGWSNGVMNYTIYRSIDDRPYEQIASLSSTINTYSDDISQYVLPEISGQYTQGHFCYYVEAREVAKSGVSKSNISCAHQETVLFVPNAFNPYSHTEANRTFKPVISFVSDYQLIIYNRFGDIIFQSEDPLRGWEGTNKSGELLKKGTYVYHLTFRTKNNKKVDKSGQINLIY